MSLSRRKKTNNETRETDKQIKVTLHGWAAGLGFELHCVILYILNDDFDVMQCLQPSMQGKKSQCRGTFSQPQTELLLCSDAK